MSALSHQQLERRSRIPTETAFLVRLSSAISRLAAGNVEKIAAGRRMPRVGRLAAGSQREMSRMSGKRLVLRIISAGKVEVREPNRVL